MEWWTYPRHTIACVSAGGFSEHHSITFKKVMFFDSHGSTIAGFGSTGLKTADATPLYQYNFVHDDNEMFTSYPGREPCRAMRVRDVL